MTQSITFTEHCSPAASLAAIGVQLQHLDLFAPIRQCVHIAQKTVKYTPTDKLYDVFITILAGAHGVVEVNTRLRADLPLQRAFGRSACAEQSVVQQTLDHATTENVSEMAQALSTIYRAQSQGYHHQYAQTWQVLDADMSGLPCGPKAAFATKGYFAKQRNRRGRQLGRVLASLYQEIVVDQLFNGTTQLSTALKPLIMAAEEVLDLSRDKRARTIVRVDAGGGSLDDVNWLLERDYVVLAKDYSSQRAASLAASVDRWYDDPKESERQIGLVRIAPSEYVREVVRIAVRCRKANGQWGYGVLIAPVEIEPIEALLGQKAGELNDEAARLLAYVYAYDQRGGGVESSLRDDKQGLGLTKRNKKRFEAQQILTMLGTLAHNVIMWARRWLTGGDAKVARYGIVRLVRDVFHITGRIALDAQGQVVRIMLNQAAPHVREVVTALQLLLAPAHVAVSLGEI